MILSDVHPIASDEMYCSHCGSVIKKEAEICPKCGCRVAPAPASVQKANPDDKPSTGLAFLSFIIPLLGLILFLVWHKTFPAKAKSCAMGAIFGFVIGLVITMIIQGCS